MNNDQLTEIKKSISFLLNSHEELIKAMQINNKGLMEMNILIRGLMSLLAENKVNSNE